MDQPPTIDIFLFAAARQRQGAAHITLELSGPTSLTALRSLMAARFPALAELLPQCRVAINETFAPDDLLVRPGDTVAIIPPVSGGTDRKRAWLSEHPLHLRAVLAEVEHAGAGGIVTFQGTVRANSCGHTITHLHYSAYAVMAEREMARIVSEVEAAVEHARVAVAHRIGTLHVGELAVAIAASAPHRAEAFEACRQTIEALKRDVPIWKQEFSTTGASWFGQGP